MFVQTNVHANLDLLVQIVDKSYVLVNYLTVQQFAIQETEHVPHLTNAYAKLDILVQSVPSQFAIPNQQMTPRFALQMGNV